MANNDLIQLTETIKQGVDLVNEQARAWGEIVKQMKAINKEAPSEYIRMQKEMVKVLKEQEVLEREHTKTLEQKQKLEQQLQKTKQQEIITTQRETDLKRKAVQLSGAERREMESQERARERKAKQLINENSAYIKLQTAWRNAQRALADSIVTDGQKANSTKKLQAEFNALDKRIKQVDVATKNYSKNVGNYSSAMVGLGSQLAGALGWAGAIGTVVALGKSFYDTTKQLQVINKSMELGSKDAQAYASNVEFLSNITNKYGLELISTSQAYNKFYVASKNKLALEQIQLIFDKVSKSASLMGMSMYDQEGIFKALEQMMSKGTVQAEELRMQLGDRLPGAFETMARAVGVTTAQLGDMMKRGEVVASEVLPKFAIELEKSFGADKVEMIDNIVSAENRMTNAWTNFVKSVNDGSSAITTVIKGVYNQIAETINEWNRLLRTSESNIANAGMNISNKVSERVKKTGEDSRQVAEQMYKQNLLFAEKHEKDLQALVSKYQQRNKGDLSGIVTNVEYKRLTGALEKIQKENEALYGIVNKPIEKVEESVNELTEKEIKEAEKQRLLREKESEKARLQAEKEAEERAKLDFQIRQTTLSNQIESNKRMAELNSSSADELIVIQTDYLMAKLELLDLEYKEEVRLADGNAQKIELAKIKHNDSMLKLMDEATKLTVDANKKMYDDIDKEAEKANKEAEKRMMDRAEKLSEYLSKYTDLGKFGFSSLNIFKEVDENGNFAFVEMIKNMEDWKDKASAIVGAVGDVMKDMYASLTANSQAYFDQQYANLENEKKFAIQFTGENTAGREAIEAQYNEKKRAIQKQEAKQQKQSAIFNASISTAQAIVAMLAEVPWPANLVMAGLVGVLGAVQIASIASTPLPQYYTGTDNAKEGWALTQERGAEVITNKHGKVKTMGNDGGAQLTYLNAGDKVYKTQEDYFNRELNDVLMSNGIAPSINVENKGISKDEMMDVLYQTLGKQPKNSLVIDEKGFNLYNEKRNSRQINKNRNARV